MVHTSKTIMAFSTLVITVTSLFATGPVLGNQQALAANAGGVGVSHIGGGGIGVSHIGGGGIGRVGHFGHFGHFRYLLQGAIMNNS